MDRPRAALFLLLAAAALRAPRARAAALDDAQKDGAALSAASAALDGARQEPAPVRKDAIAFYFSAHEDDWQLFMNPPAFEDVAAAEDPESPLKRVVFVHVTAGDDGTGMDEGSPKPFYLARENGAKVAIRFMSDASPGRLSGTESESEAVVNGHRLLRVSYRNTADYFLRLPDGNGTGQGFERTGWQSLQRLRNGDIKTMTAIDGSAVYAGWTDLIATLRAVIDRESAGSREVTLHIPQTDPALNPGDHPDHHFMAVGVRQAAADLPGARCISHETYGIAGHPANLGPKERDMQVAVFAATVTGITSAGGASTWEQHYKVWLGRGYSRAGACAEGGP